MVAADDICHGTHDLDSKVASLYLEVHGTNNWVLICL